MQQRHVSLLVSKLLTELVGSAVFNHFDPPALRYYNEKAAAYCWGDEIRTKEK